MGHRGLRGERILLRRHNAHGDEFDNVGPFVRCYYDTIRRAASNGWERVGHHVVRRCKVSECGQTGIHSSLGAAFSTIEDCEIFHCNWKRGYGGADTAGLKLLCSVDVTIRNNRIHHNGGYGGIWLDWMSQGARVVGNTDHSMLCVPILFTGRWSAAVNGKPVQVLNINGGLCGIPLEKGENEVVMTYSLPFFGVSVMVSLITAAALLAALILWAVRRKKAPDVR